MGNRADARPWFKDGSVDFSGGMDAAAPPSTIERVQVAWAVNATMRLGTIGPRPGWKKRSLTFDSGIESMFKNGRFQDVCAYDSAGEPFAIAVHGGRAFRVDLRTMAVMEITPAKMVETANTASYTVPAAGSTAILHVNNTAGADLRLTTILVGAYQQTLVSIDSGTQLTLSNPDSDIAGTIVAAGATVKISAFDVNSPAIDQGWHTVVENYWAYQDGQSYPIICDGGSARRSNPSRDEIPVGNVMVEAMGRLIVALPDKRTYMAGDLVFSSSGTQPYGYRDAVLRFTENKYLNEGGNFLARVFGAPSNGGDILAMTPLAMTDTSLGQGPVLISQPNQVFTLNLPFDRTTWKDLNSPLQTVSPLQGATGPNSAVQVNGDVWYRAVDGIRSYRIAQAQFNGQWGNTPMSLEVSSILDHDTQWLLKYGSCVLFDNRLLTTVGPVRTDHGIYHGGILALDFSTVSGANKSRRGRASQPVWDGLWTGLRILRIFTATVDDQPKCFLWVLNNDSEIEVWELSRADTTDGGTPITWETHLPAYNCQDSDRFKRLDTGRIIFTNISGSVSVAVKYMTDAGPCTQDWDSFTLCARAQDCSIGICAGPTTYQPQSRYPITLRRPPDTEDATHGKYSPTGYEFQPIFRITGYAQIKEFRIYCIDAPEPVFAEVTRT